VAHFNTDEVARAGLYMGPGLLGSIVANGVYRIMCEGRSTFIAVGVPSSWLVLGLAILFIAAGSRSSSRHKLGIASSIFIAVLCLSFVAHRYGDSLLGRDTIFRAAPLCSSAA
jgi:hypothetical protein